jgi:hypothetical protein
MRPDPVTHLLFTEGALFVGVGNGTVARFQRSFTKIVLDCGAEMRRSVKTAKGQKVEASVLLVARAGGKPVWSLEPQKEDPLPGNWREGLRGWDKN